MIAIARMLVRVAAALVPAGLRDRWREEWLGEVDAADRRSWRAVLSFALGAPRDALAARRGAGRRRVERPARLARWRATVAGDTRHAWRLLRRRPGYTFAIVTCLALGLIASIGTFSALTSLLYGDQPGIVGRRQLARVFLSYDRAMSMETVAGGARVAAEVLSLDDFAILRDLPPDATLGALSAAGDAPATIASPGGPVTVLTSFVSGDFFRTLGTQPLIGRLLVPADEQTSAAPVAVITESFWRTHFDSDPGVVGRTMHVSLHPFVIVGVAPPRFRGLSPFEDDAHGVQVWVPLSHVATWPARPASDQPWLSAVGRRRAEATRQDVEAQLTVLASRLAAADPVGRSGARAVVRPHGFGPGDAPVQVLLVISLILSLPLTILAIGVANVANLQLSSAAERARELAVRLSLGASRASIVRLLVLESFARTAVAVILSFGVLAAVRPVAQRYLPMLISFDWRVVLFSVAITVVVTLGTGLVPGWLAVRRPEATQLKTQTRGSHGAYPRLRAALVVTQIALSIVLLSVAGVVVRTVDQIHVGAPPVLASQLVARFDLGDLGLSSAERGGFAAALLERAAADPRVESAALSHASAVRVARAGTGAPPDRLATLAFVSPSWYGVMDAPLLSGRHVTPADGTTAVVVSRRVADDLWAGDALGQRLAVEDGRRRRDLNVVGVVADVPIRRAIGRLDPVIYVAIEAEPPPAFTVRWRLRSLDQASSVSGDLRSLVASIDSRVAWTTLQRGDAAYEADAREMVVVASAIGAFGVVAVILATTGLYAVVAYSVTLRRQEIGVRLAIGASPGRIVALIVRDALRLSLIGTAVGLALAVPVAFAMRATFVEPVNALDPVAFAPTVAILLVAALVAAALPARRAAAFDPMAMLRVD